MHLAFAAFAVLALFRLGSPAAWAIAGLTPLIAWSRIRLRRHTLVEVIAGAALGILAGALPGWR